MDKREFISVLRQCLADQMPDYEVENNVRYYEEYLADDERSTKEEKIRELGDPRLIARTIVDAYMANQGIPGYREGRRGQSYDEEGAYEEAAEDGRHAGRMSFGEMKWYQKLAAVAVSVALVVGVFALFFLGTGVFFRFVLPVLFPILVIGIGVKLIIDLFR